MLGACLYFVLQLPSHVPSRVCPASRCARAARSNSPPVIDVAGGVSALMVPSLVYLGRASTSPPWMIATPRAIFPPDDERRPRAGRELSSTSPSCPALVASAPTRRVLVLMH